MQGNPWKVGAHSAGTEAGGRGRELGVRRSRCGTGECPWCPFMLYPIGGIRCRHLLVAALCVVPVMVVLIGRRCRYGFSTPPTSMRAVSECLFGGLMDKIDQKVIELIWKVCHLKSIGCISHNFRAMRGGSCAARGWSGQISGSST